MHEKLRTNQVTEKVNKERQEGRECRIYKPTMKEYRRA